MNSIDNPVKTRAILTLRRAKEISKAQKRYTVYPRPGNEFQLAHGIRFNTSAYLVNEAGRLYVRVYFPVELNMYWGYDAAVEELKEILSKK